MPSPSSDCREDLRREHDPGERDRDLRYDGDVEDPLRPAQCHLDDAPGLGDRDRFGQRPVGAGTAAHGVLLFIFTLHRHTICAGTTGIYLEKEHSQGREQGYETSNYPASS